MEEGGGAILVVKGHAHFVLPFLKVAILMMSIIMTLVASEMHYRRVQETQPSPEHNNVDRSTELRSWALWHPTQGHFVVM